MSQTPSTPLQRPRPEYLVLGEILRPHGVRGELRMRIITDFPERLQQLDVVYLASSLDSDRVRPYELESVRFHQEYALLQFKEIENRDTADLLRGQLVLIDLASAVPLDEDEYYLYEIIGLQVRTEDGQSLGHITDILETGANDVYILHSEKFGELLVPAHDETIIDINFDEEVVTMRLPEGLLPTS